MIDLGEEPFTAKAKLYHHGIQTPASLDYFPEEDRVYYSDIRQGMILSVFSNATSLKVLFSCNVIKPLGLVIDKPGRNIFWTDAGTRRIEVGRLDGKKRKLLIEKGIEQPAAIVLDIPRGWAFTSLLLSLPIGVTNLYTYSFTSVCLQYCFYSSKSVSKCHKKKIWQQNCSDQDSYVYD